MVLVQLESCVHVCKSLANLEDAAEPWERWIVISGLGPSALLSEMSWVPLWNAQEVWWKGGTAACSPRVAQIPSAP